MSTKTNILSERDIPSEDLISPFCCHGNTNYVLGATLCTFHIVLYVSLKTTLQGWYYSVHLADKEDVKELAQGAQLEYNLSRVTPVCECLNITLYRPSMPLEARIMAHICPVYL